MLLKLPLKGFASCRAVNRLLPDGVKEWKTSKIEV
jgi:hypothetical protein